MIVYCLILPLVLSVFMFWDCITRCIKIGNYCTFLSKWPLYHYELFLFVSSINSFSKAYFVDVGMTNLILFWLIFVRYIFYSSTSNISGFPYWKYVSCKWAWTFFFKSVLLPLFYKRRLLTFCLMKLLIHLTLNLPSSYLFYIFLSFFVFLLDFLKKYLKY